MTHIKAFTDKNGVVHPAHDDKRPEARPWWTKVLDKVPNPPKAHQYQPKEPHYPNARIHPELDEAGKPVTIREPHSATPDLTWTEKSSIATFVPGGPVPKSLNGVPFKPWEPPVDLEAWAEVEGQKPSLREPELPRSGKAQAAGVIIEEPDGRVWVIHPTNGYGGYKGTFPKGHEEEGLNLHATAIKEAFEESGLKVEITGFAGDVERTTTTCRYYTAKRVAGTPLKMGWEAQAVSLVPRSKLYNVLNNYVDHDMAETLGAGPKPEPPPKPVYKPDMTKPVPSGNFSGGKPWF